MPIGLTDVEAKQIAVFHHYLTHLLAKFDPTSFSKELNEYLQHLPPILVAQAEDSNQSLPRPPLELLEYIIKFTATYDPNSFLFNWRLYSIRFQKPMITKLGQELGQLSLAREKRNVINLLLGLWREAGDTAKSNQLALDRFYKIDSDIHLREPKAIQNYLNPAPALAAQVPLSGSAAAASAAAGENPQSIAAANADALRTSADGSADASAKPRSASDGEVAAKGGVEITNDNFATERRTASAGAKSTGDPESFAGELIKSKAGGDKPASSGASAVAVAVQQNEGDDAVASSAAADGKQVYTKPRSASDSAGSANGSTGSASGAKLRKKRPGRVVEIVSTDSEPPAATQEVSSVSPPLAQSETQAAATAVQTQPMGITAAGSSAGVEPRADSVGTKPRAASADAELLVVKAGAGDSVSASFSFASAATATDSRVSTDAMQPGSEGDDKKAGAGKEKKKNKKNKMDGADSNLKEVGANPVSDAGSTATPGAEAKPAVLAEGSGSDGTGIASSAPASEHTMAGSATPLARPEGAGPATPPPPVLDESSSLPGADAAPAPALSSLPLPPGLTPQVSMPQNGMPPDERLQQPQPQTLTQEQQQLAAIERLYHERSSACRSEHQSLTEPLALALREQRISQSIYDAQLEVYNLQYQMGMLVIDYEYQQACLTVIPQQQPVEASRDAASDSAPAVQDLGQQRSDLEQAFSQKNRELQLALHVATKKRNGLRREEDSELLRTHQKQEMDKAQDKPEQQAWLKEYHAKQLEFTQLSHQFTELRMDFEFEMRVLKESHRHTFESQYFSSKMDAEKESQFAQQCQKELTALEADFGPRLQAAEALLTEKQRELQPMYLLEITRVYENRLAELQENQIREMQELDQAFQQQQISGSMHSTQRTCIDLRYQLLGMEAESQFLRQKSGLLLQQLFPLQHLLEQQQQQLSEGTDSSVQLPDQLQESIRICQAEIQQLQEQQQILFQAQRGTHVELRFAELAVVRATELTYLLRGQSAPAAADTSTDRETLAAKHALEEKILALRHQVNVVILQGEVAKEDLTLKYEANLRQLPPFVESDETIAAQRALLKQQYESALQEVERNSTEKSQELARAIYQLQQQLQQDQQPPAPEEQQKQSQQQQLPDPVAEQQQQQLLQEQRQAALQQQPQLQQPEPEEQSRHQPQLQQQHTALQQQQQLQLRLEALLADEQAENGNLQKRFDAEMAGFDQGVADGRISQPMLAKLKQAADLHYQLDKHYQAFTFNQHRISLTSQFQSQDQEDSTQATSQGNPVFQSYKQEMQQLIQDHDLRVSALYAELRPVEKAIRTLESKELAERQNEFADDTEHQTEAWQEWISQYHVVQTLQLKYQHQLAELREKFSDDMSNLQRLHRLRVDQIRSTPGQNNASDIKALERELEQKLQRRQAEFDQQERQIRQSMSEVEQELEHLVHHKPPLKSEEQAAPKEQQQPLPPPQPPATGASSASSAAPASWSKTSKHVKHYQFWTEAHAEKQSKILRQRESQPAGSREATVLTPQENVQLILDLLDDYAGWNCVTRFFSGKWNRSHIKEVERMLDNCVDVQDLGALKDKLTDMITRIPGFNPDSKLLGLLHVLESQYEHALGELEQATVAKIKPPSA